MRKRKVTVTIGLPELEPDEASPSKRRSFGARVGAAVSRIEAAEAAAARQVHMHARRVVEAAPAAPPGREGFSTFVHGWCVPALRAPTLAAAAGALMQLNIICLAPSDVRMIDA